MTADVFDDKIIDREVSLIQNNNSLHTKKGSSNLIINEDLQSRNKNLNIITEEMTDQYPSGNISDENSKVARKYVDFMSQRVSSKLSGTAGNSTNGR